MHGRSLRGQNGSREGPTERGYLWEMLCTISALYVSECMCAWSLAAGFGQDQGWGTCIVQYIYIECM